MIVLEPLLDVPVDVRFRPEQRERVVDRPAGRAERVRDERERDGRPEDHEEDGERDRQFGGDRRRDRPEVFQLEDVIVRHRADRRPRP